MRKLILISASMVVFSLSGNAFAQEDPSMENCFGNEGCSVHSHYNYWDSKTSKIYYTIEDGKMLIYGATNTGGGTSSNEIGQYALAGSTWGGVNTPNSVLNGVTEIKIVGNVDSIKGNAFQYSAGNIVNADFSGVQTLEGRVLDGANLQNLNLKGIQTIGNNAFYNSNIQNLNIENVGTIGEHAFSWASAGSPTVMGTINLKNVETISADSFYGFSATTLNLENVGSIGNRAFYNLKNVETLNLTGAETVDSLAFNGAEITTVNLKDMGTVNGFYGSKVENVNLENVKKIGDSCFNNVSGLKSIDLNGVEEIGNSAFYYSSSLENIDLTGVKKIGNYAFYNTKKLTDLTISDSLESVGTNAFYNVKPTNLTINSDKMDMFLNTGGSLANIENIYCLNSADACRAYLSEKYKNSPSYLASLLAKVKDAPVKAKEEKMADGSIKMFRDGKFVGWKNKRIYTVQEANEVAGRKNKVKIRYK